MSDYRVATRYAKSLLELAVEKNVLDQVHNDMQLFSQVVKENREFGLLLKNPVIKNDKKRSVIQAIFQGKFNALTMAMIDIMSRKNRELSHLLTCERPSSSFVVLAFLLFNVVDTDAWFFRLFLLLVEEAPATNFLPVELLLRALCIHADIFA